jgi:type II secretory pathway component PulM
MDQLRDWLAGLAPRERNLVYAAGGLVIVALLAAGAAAGSGESLVVLVDRTGREAGLGGALRDQSPSGDQGLRLRLEAAPFDVLVVWLASLQQQYGVKVDAATIDATAAPGLVNASLTLTHGATAGP